MKHAIVTKDIDMNIYNVRVKDIGTGEILTNASADEIRHNDNVLTITKHFRDESVTHNYTDVTKVVIK